MATAPDGLWRVSPLTTRASAGPGFESRSSWHVQSWASLCRPWWTKRFTAAMGTDCSVWVDCYLLWMQGWVIIHGFWLPYFRRTWLFQLGWRPLGVHLMYDDRHCLCYYAQSGVVTNRTFLHNKSPVNQHDPSLFKLYTSVSRLIIIQFFQNIGLLFKLAFIVLRD